MCDSWGDPALGSATFQRDKDLSMTTLLLEQPVTATEPTHEMTVEEFELLPSDHRSELLDGKVVPRNMGAQASEVGNRVGAKLWNWSEPIDAGRVYGSECGYQIFGEGRNRVRYPDVSFVDRSRLPGGRSPRGFFRIAPDLAAEVVSPNDLADDVESKRVEFMEAGTGMYWILYPEARTIHIFRPNLPPLILLPSDELRGLAELPGFACRVADLFG